MTEPAAEVPSSPCSRMARVVATFRARRSRVVTSRSDGKMENSRGEVMNMDVTRMTSPSEMETESMKSMNGVGRGMSITKRMTTTPPASRTSPCLANLV
jgi:hypothetical protein